MTYRPLKNTITESRLPQLHRAHAKFEPKTGLRLIRMVEGAGKGITRFKLEVEVEIIASLRLGDLDPLFEGAAAREHVRSYTRTYAEWTAVCAELDERAEEAWGRKLEEWRRHCQECEADGTPMPKQPMRREAKHPPAPKLLKHTIPCPSLRRVDEGVPVPLNFDIRAEAIGSPAALDLRGDVVGTPKLVVIGATVTMTVRSKVRLLIEDFITVAGAMTRDWQITTLNSQTSLVDFTKPYAHATPPDDTEPDASPVVDAPTDSPDAPTEPPKPQADPAEQPRRRRRGEQADSAPATVGA